MQPEPRLGKTQSPDIPHHTLLGGWLAGPAQGAHKRRPVCYVTLTIDHRVLDGYQANAFLARCVEEIEGWALASGA